MKGLTVKEEELMGYFWEKGPINSSSFTVNPFIFTTLLTANNEKF